MNAPDLTPEQLRLSAIALGSTNADDIVQFDVPKPPDEPPDFNDLVQFALGVGDDSDEMHWKE